MTKPVHPTATPDRKTVLLVGLAFVALLGAYLLGRASPASAPAVVAREASATSVPGQTAVPEPGQPTTDPAEVLGGPGLLADLGGSGELIAEVPLSADRSAMVLCRRGATERLSVSYLDTTTQPPALLGHTEIPKAVRCAECSIEVIELAGEPVGLGHCATEIQRGAFAPDMATSLAFTIAEPPSEIFSAVGVVIDCGQTELRVEGDELLLFGEPPSPAQSPPVRSNPPIRFSRRGERFEANDLPLLRHYCNASGSRQLFGYLPDPESWYSGRSALSYLETDSQVGTIGFRRQVLVALTPQQCSTLIAVQRDWLAGEPTTLADVTGLEPPDGTDNWFLTCQRV